MPMTWTVPNILTVMRLLAAPMLAVMFLYFDRLYADWFALILFISAAITDYIDGYLAREWKQETKLGAMLDPIADKAMVVIALMVIVGYSSMSPWLVLPATVILFREVFVSGLREFLGDVAGTLKVTNLAKWKTTAQMVAISVLFAHGVFEHYFGMQAYITVWAGHAGMWLLWLAALLTLLSGADYLAKAMPHLKEGER